MLEMPKDNRARRLEEDQVARKAVEDTSDDKCKDDVSIDSAYLRSLEEQVKGDKKK
jgi:hypothetical protein